MIEQTPVFKSKTGLWRSVWCISWKVISNRVFLLFFSLIGGWFLNVWLRPPQEIQVPPDYAFIYQMDQRPKPWYYLFFKLPKAIILNNEGADAYYGTKYHDARNKFEAGIALNPHLSCLHNNRAVALNQITMTEGGNYQYMVLAELNWAIELDPKNPIPYENLALIHGGVPFDKGRECLAKAYNCEKRPKWKAWLKMTLGRPD